MHRSILLPALLTAVLATAQDQPEPAEVTISGRVTCDQKDRRFYDLMIVNKRTRTGSFGNSDGTYSVKALKTDTIMIGATELKTVMITVKDSAEKASYTVNVHLMPLHYVMKEAEIFPRRKLEEIEKDIASLGYDKHDYQLSGIDAFQSPITFLYQEFSRRERSKREVAYLINEDRKRDLLRELLRKYVAYDIINLSDDSFDDFIDFCKVPDEVIKGLSQYDFILYVKKKYELYTSLGPTRAH